VTGPRITFRTMFSMTAALSFCATAAHAVDAAATAPVAAPATSATAAAGLSLELNKLETYDKGCRAYTVVNNTTDTTYQSFKLDLVLFQSDGVIGKRVALDLSPVKPQKKTVKLFELDGIACDKIGSFLINDVLDCKSDSGPAENCLQNLKTSTLTNVQLSK
jgi:hypothetical protein